MRLELISHLPETPTHRTPILFLHGAWHGAWCWEANFLPYFAQQGYEVHAMSLRGHGLSEGREALRRASMEEYVTDLVEVVRALPTPPVIVGHSLGGFIVQKYLEHYSAPAVVLLAPAPAYGGWRFTMRQIEQQPLTFVWSALTLSPYVLIDPVEKAHKAFFSADLPREQVARYFAQMQEESFRAYLDFLILALPDTRRIRKCGVPILILGGAQDRIFLVEELVELGKHYQADVVILPQIAHDMMLEAKWQTAADRIIAWLQAHEIA